ncbi:hypothetical protein [Propionivibrio limicola]|uniref:hypothetical protein n=1 Tax=Propionivibrio limicola TaxID=167645 RepID=UPI0012919075|nr:hypothetical protein [Propionivibrio limicola]
MHYVHFSKPALVQSLMNGFEAFVVKHGNKKRHAIEFYGLLFGHTEETSRTVHHHVDFVSIDSSADMNGGWVQNNEDATFLKEQFAYGAGYDFLGSIHTHPYLSQEMTLPEARTSGSHFSDSDLQNFHEQFSEDSFFGRPFSVHAVLAIRNKDDESERQRIERDGYLEPNIFEFSLANCKCFLKAQVFSCKNGVLKREDTSLKSDYLEKFGYLEGSFGSVKLVDGKQRIVEHVA